MRLGSKLTIAFGAVTLLPLAPLTLVAREVIANRYREELHRSLDAAVTETEHTFEQTARGVERSAARLTRADDPFATVVARTLLTRDASGALPADARAALSDDTAREARTRGLDLLVIVGPDGVVLVSPSDPAREGTPDPELLQRVRASGPRARVVEERPRFVRQGPGRLAVEVARPLGPDGAQPALWLVAGVWLDDALPERAGDIVERHLRPSAAAPEGALVRRIELDAGAQTAIPVELWAIDRGLRAALADLNIAAAVLAAGGVVLALLVGAFIAGRITARLTRLAEAADAIAKGQRDLALPIVGSDEVATLTGRFNEMAGALAGAEESAIRAERVAAWREMAQHLAHELKNPLTPIQMSIETLQRTRARPDRAADFDRLFDESAKVILDEVGRLKSIVGEFSRFARLPAPTFAAVDVRELCDAAARLYDGALPIERDLGECGARADRDQLQQVLVNLLENAREAVAGVAQRRVLVRCYTRAGRVFFEVHDNGSGIADAVRARLFQPYVTGKPGGTGLGLALVQRIVTEHGGRVSAEEGLPTTTGHGACFRVELATWKASP